MKYVKNKLAVILPGLLLAAGLMCLTASPARAQEGEAVVVDEVIAQVNDNVLTLSMLKRAQKDAVDTLVAQGKSREDALAEVESKKSEMISGLINEQLLLAKGKELNLAQDVEAEVNQRLMAAGKDQGITKLEDLCAAMKQSGLDCDEVRDAMRIEMMKVAVLNREVDAKVFYDTPDAELQAYFKSHPEKFKKPESVDLSEIFLDLAGKNEAEVMAKANQLVAQLRAGADFGTLAKANSERIRNGVRTAQEDEGHVGLLEVPNLKAEFAAGIKNVKPGGVSDPILMPEGIQILKVNSRDAAADTPKFNENAVREAIVMEKGPAARKAYLEKARQEAYIKIAEGYKAMVGPLVGEAVTPSSVTTAENKEKKSDKKDKKQ